MAQATAQKDDDLIIIADESENNESIFSLDFWDDTPSENTDEVTKVEKNDIIIQKEDREDIWEIKETLEIIDKSWEIKEEAHLKEEENDKIEIISNDDVSFDFWLEDSTQKESTPEKDVIVTELPEEANTQLWETEDIVEIPIPDTDNQWLNLILEQTIIKLEERKKNITIETEQKTKNVESLKDEIQKLENEVSQRDAEITSLGLEYEKIENNITKLHDMKLDPVKDYNAKRSVKK